MLLHNNCIYCTSIAQKLHIPTKIWVWNPGKLLPQLTIDGLKREHPSYPRNLLIANAFYLADFIERWESGTRRIVDLYKKQGLPEPEYKDMAAMYVKERGKNEA